VALRGAVWLGKGKGFTRPSPLAAREPHEEPLRLESAEPLQRASTPPPVDRPQVPPAFASANQPPQLPETPATQARIDQSPGTDASQEVVLRFGDRRWRVRGLARNTSYDSLKVNLLCGHKEAFHVDNFDLYSARHRQAFLKTASEELGVKEEVLKKDLGQVLIQLEMLQDEKIRQALAPQDEAPQMTETERAEAMALLASKGLLGTILADFERCGVVGEETNKLVGYLAAVSRKLEEPLAVIIQSSSAAGKSSLMDAVLALMPEEERLQYSAMTGQSLFYMGETNLKHKILAIVEEEGAERASYALKLLQSEGVLTIAATGKDPTTGRMVTHEYRVEGPVMIFLTTTAIEIDDELLNRCLVLTVNEDRAQTEAIHARQRHARTLEGLLAHEERSQVQRVHRNAQRLLRPFLVANPYAEQLTFVSHRTRTRRDHVKYLTLIQSIALLHQYQRPVKRVQRRGVELEYIEVTLDDIEVANRLAHQVLGRSLDELPPQTRRLLCALDEMVAAGCKRQEISRSDYRFSRREVREYTGWGLTQLRVHMERLVELEYVLVHRGRNGVRFEYELALEGGHGGWEPQLVGLVEVEKLRSHDYDRNLAGSHPPPSGASGAPGGDLSGTWRGGKTAATPLAAKRINGTWRPGGESTSGANFLSAVTVAEDSDHTGEA
jgi:DNA primase